MENITQDSIKNGLCGLYRKYGYSAFKVSKFEEYDFYAQNRSFLSCKRVLTFNDTDGRLMALKPDVTLSIIKNITANDRLRKLYYTENVFRVGNNADGFREIMQTGLEYIGKLDSCAIAEVLALAAKSLELVSEDYRLDISDLRIISGILDDEGIKPEKRAAIFKSISRKNPHGTADICVAAGMSEFGIGLINELSAIYGGLEESLEIISRLPLPRKSREAVGTLSKISESLKCYGIKNAMLDMTLVSDSEYYTGIVLGGYVAGVPNQVLAGGSYDELMRKMNKPQNAIGFAVYLDRLEALGYGVQKLDGDVLLLADEANMPKAIMQAEQLRAEGKTVLLCAEAPEELKFNEVIEVK